MSLIQLHIIKFSNKMLFEIIKMKVNPDQYIRKVVRTNTPILDIL